ncbi:hypothetical protein [Burkholderia territorii]|uniref:hypothetical protein n=1 Tax=Burkholderia territorii TaxID=1503055 RepID=UPI0014547C62|nr:hypothetical protein [Burkholderia territorii]VWB42181.1 two component sigma54 specific Fis family transcriptional regulator [Burkholderia territorii]
MHSLNLEWGRAVIGKSICVKDSELVYGGLLVYRLNVVRIEIPPLRERSERIASIVDHFIAEHNQRRAMHVGRPDSALLERLVLLAQQVLARTSSCSRRWYRWACSALSSRAGGSTP